MNLFTSFGITFADTHVALSDVEQEAHAEDLESVS
jgi:hypothetical protein